MNAVTNTHPRQLTPVQTFVEHVLNGDKRDEIARALPSHVSFARWERNLSNALMREPKLLKCDPRIVFREVAKIAALGLVLDPQLGEAYLIVDRNNDVQSRIGYRGLLKLAHQSGKVSAIYAHDICEMDVCEIDLGTEKRIVHKPNFMQPRGPVGAYYAAVRFRDGATDFEPMSIGEVHAIRGRSDAYRAFKRGLIKSTPWDTDEGEMSKKTVLRRLLKRVPMSPDMDRALSLEDEADHRDRTIDGVALPSAPKSIGARLDALAGVTNGDPEPEAPVDPETGEYADNPPSPHEGEAHDSPAPSVATEPAGRTATTAPAEAAQGPLEADRNARKAEILATGNARTQGGTKAMAAYLLELQKDGEIDLVSNIQRSAWHDAAKAADAERGRAAGGRA